MVKKIANYNFELVALSKRGRNELFQYFIAGGATALEPYLQLIDQVLTVCNKQPSELVFVDYGGGLGMLSLLAKQIGFKQVIYTDIDADACSDAHAIGSALGLQADHYVHGDINHMIADMHEKNILCDVLVSYDVIEHVYNLEDFLQKLKNIAYEQKKHIFLASSAHSANPKIKKNLAKLHYMHEHEGRFDAWHEKDVPSFFSMRKEIIRVYDPTLTLHEIDQLAQTTRGKKQSDIHAIVDAYKHHKIMPTVPEDSNTCDPYTGNWSERILDPHVIESCLRNQGFKTQLIYEQEQHVKSNWYCVYAVI